MNSGKASSRALSRNVRFPAFAFLLLCAFETVLVARPLHPTAGGHHASVDHCALHPELFKVRPLTPNQAMGLIQRAAEVPTIRKFDRGYIVSGECIRFIKTFSNGIILTNNARFGIKNFAFIPVPPADQNTVPMRSLFVPPANVLKIDSNIFAPGRALSLVQTFPFGSDTELVLWSNQEKSVLGTVRCRGKDQRPCTLDHFILSSHAQIREFDFLPAPHAEMTVGELWLQIALNPLEEAVATYTIDYGELYSSGAS
jgi:hypothetical protein